MRRRLNKMSFQKEYEDYLAHYGVPGMKWGHRKSQAKGYTDKAVKRDRALYGDRKVRKINSKMLKGASYMQARHEVGEREYKKGDRLYKIGRVVIPVTATTAAIAAGIASKKLEEKHNTAAHKYNEFIRMGGRDVSGGAIKKRFANLRNAVYGTKVASALIPLVGLAGAYSLMTAGSKRRRKYKSYEQ